MSLDLSRRKLVTNGLVTALFAPVIIRMSNSLMPIRPLSLDFTLEKDEWREYIDWHTRQISAAMGIPYNILMGIK